MSRTFKDRRDAGRRLAGRLAGLATERPVVVALPRGGVPVGFEVARGLGAPLDVLVVRKVGAPGNAELGMGAVAEGGVRVFNEATLRRLEVSAEEMSHAVAQAEREVEDRLRRYRGERPPVEVEGRTVVLVDDGLATGGTACAAARALRARRPARLVLAVPVGAQESVAALAPEVDEIVCLLTPEPMWAVGHWYEDFGQTTDAEVARLLARAGRFADVPDYPAVADGPDGPEEAVVAPRREAVRIPLGAEAAGEATGEAIAGDLVVPAGARGIVLFAHGSGSSRHSPRNREVAAGLQAEGLATLLIDLLTPAEERVRANVFDVELLAGRLVAATRWVRAHPRLGALPLGYFGASTGAAAALRAAAELGPRVAAIVSRGGRPDLAMARLDDVTAPTLLIVGGHDDVVIELNRRALARLRGEADLRIVPGASHLFEEPGALDAVERLAGDWFTRHLARATSPPGRRAAAPRFRRRPFVTTRKEGRR